MLPIEWIAPFTAAAFCCGFIAHRLGLPALIGFLGAGFLLRALGYESNPTLNDLADLGVTLLLFAIGLKLHVSDLLRPSIWAGSSLHTITFSILMTGLLWLISISSLPISSSMTLSTCLLIGFGLSFSSTVFTVKTQESQGSASSTHARIAIGFLIMQDIFAVIFLASAKGNIPSLWAICLLPGFFVIRYGMFFIMNRVGHGELLVLLGWLVPIIGFYSFEAVNIKGDLGAIVIGALLAKHRKAGEMAKSLLSFKDIFLVAFFLTIGLQAELSWSAFGISLLIVACLPLKTLLYYILLITFKHRPRTSFLSSLSLATYSEFGLIIASLAYSLGWMTDEWLAVLALCVALSFVIAAPLNAVSLSMFTRWKQVLEKWQHSQHLPEDMPIPIGDYKVVIFGMGGVGITCYDQLRLRNENAIIGVDNDPEHAKRQVKAGRHVVSGDASDAEFWERCDPGQTQLVLLCLPKLPAMVEAAKQLRKRGYQGPIAALARFEDDREKLKKAGVDHAYGLYQEAGIGLIESMEHCLKSEIDNQETNTTRSE